MRWSLEATLVNFRESAPNFLNVFHVFIDGVASKNRFDFSCKPHVCNDSVQPKMQRGAWFDICEFERSKLAGEDVIAARKPLFIYTTSAQ